MTGNPLLSLKLQHEDAALALLLRTFLALALPSHPETGMIAP